MSNSQIMYIEFKGDGVVGPGRIGRVTFSKTGKTIYYCGKQFQSLKGFVCDIPLHSNIGPKIKNIDFTNIIAVNCSFAGQRP